MNETVKRAIRIGLLSAFLASTVAYSQTPGPAILRIDAGGGPSGSWLADEYGSSSSTYATTAKVATALVANPAPQAVYQSERSGVFTYTIPNLTPGATYPINLHFAEIYFQSVGQRQFDVSINGTEVLKNFDIIAAAGGENIAVVRQFTATASTKGKISIAFTNGEANQAKISGIEVLPPPWTIPFGGPLYTCL